MPYLCNGHASAHRYRYNLGSKRHCAFVFVWCAKQFHHLWGKTRAIPFKIVHHNRWDLYKKSHLTQITVLIALKNSQFIQIFFYVKELSFMIQPKIVVYIVIFSFHVPGSERSCCRSSFLERLSWVVCHCLSSVVYPCSILWNAERQATKQHRPLKSRMSLPCHNVAIYASTHIMTIIAAAAAAAAAKLCPNKMLTTW